MQTTSPKISPIPLPDVAADEPVAVIPTASVAPLGGRPDGERINVFTLAPKNDSWALKDLLASDAFGDVRERVTRKPLTYAAVAFSLGFVIARVLR